MVVPTVALLVISAGRARASGSDGADGPAVGELVPVPMPVVEPAPPEGAPASTSASEPDGAAPGDRDTLTPDEERRIVGRARLEIDRVRKYDAGWLAVSGYPMGDIREDRGACTDVVVRSLRAIGRDLQQEVHEDILAAPTAYRGVRADWTIDHRRISTMFRYLSRHALSLSTKVRDRDSFRPGDIVFTSPRWERGSAPTHVAVVSDAVGPRGLPLVIENGGPLPAEADSLGRRMIVGHFRVRSR